MNKLTKQKMASAIIGAYPDITVFTDVQVLDIVKDTKLDVKQVDNVLFYYRLDLDKLYMNVNIEMENYL